MAEDLGEITIKFGEGGAAPSGGAGAGAAASQARTVADAAKAAMSGILQNLPAIARVAQSGMRGGTIGTVASATQVAAAGIAGAGVSVAAVLAPVLAIAAGLAVVAVAVVAIRSFVSSIMDRVSQLASISGPMAMQDALNRISEMRRDMREAQILGPMYAQVSQLVNKIKDLLQPFLMAFKAAILSVIIPLLETVVDYLKRLFNLIPVIATYLANLGGGLQSIGGMGGYYNIMSGALAGTQAGGLFMILSWLFPPSKTSGAANTLNTIAAVLMQFYNAFQNQTQQGSNGWALNTLNALASGTAPMIVPGVPGAIPVPVRTSPARTGRSRGPTP